MMFRPQHRFNALKSGLIIAGLLLTAANAMAADLAAEPVAALMPLPIRLQTSINVNDDVIKLSDLFEGLPPGADKAIAEAPRAGQRIMLTADWLQKVAYDHGVAWTAQTKFERAVVYRPSQIIPASDIIAAIKTELTNHGVPDTYAIKIRTPMSTIAIPTNVPKTIAVREVSVDAASHTFSVSVEMPAGSPNAYVLQIKGDAYPIITAPVPKQAILRDTIITADMIDMVDIRDKTNPDVLLDPNLIIGQAAKGYLRAGQALRAIDVYKITLVSVPVFRSEMHRGVKITETHLKWIEMNADDVPTGAILDAGQLIGFAPKRQLASGLPIRPVDVQAIDLVDVPVAARNIVRGETLTANDLEWTLIDRHSLPKETVVTEEGLVGLITNTTVRAGQPFRNHGVARPVLVTKGKLVTLIYNVATMKLTAKAKVLEDGARGQVVRVMNTKSNARTETALFAEVIDAETVRIVSQQSAMN